MTTLQRAGTIIGGIVLILHGIAHAPGALGSLKLATFEDVSYEPNLYTGAADGLVMALGVLWVVAGVAFVAAGIGLVLLRSWFRPAMGLALVTSIPLTILWYQDAVAGLVVNGLVVCGLALWAGLGWTITSRPAQASRVQLPE